MGAVAVVANSLVGQPAPPVPVKPDGTGYRYAMFHNHAAVITYADEVVDLFDALLPGYTGLDEHARLQQRIRLAVQTAAIAQAQLLTAAGAQPEQFSPEQWQALTAPRALPQPHMPYWDGDVALIGVETAYAPYTDVPAPGHRGGGDVFMIHPVDEEEFLLDLDAIGVINLSQLEDG